MHQHTPGRMIKTPNPMKPTPMMVAEVLMPRERVMTTGTVPTTARLPPTPMMTSGASRDSGIEPGDDITTAFTHSHLRRHI